MSGVALVDLNMLHQLWHLLSWKKKTLKPHQLLRWDEGENLKPHRLLGKDALYIKQNRELSWSYLVSVQPCGIIPARKRFKQAEKVIMGLKSLVNFYDDPCVA